MAIQEQNSRETEEMSLPLLRYQPPHINYQPMSLHRTRAQQVWLMGGDRSIAFKTDSEFCHSYVFTARPLQIGERVVVQLLGTKSMFQGCLGLGFTSCDPSTLTQNDLPDDPNFLLDRPEYWVLSKDFARTLNEGDEISLCISPNGEVQISRNGGAPLMVIHVDQTLRLWALFDIYGSTHHIRVLSSPSSMCPLRRIIMPTASKSMNSIKSQSEMRRNAALQQSNASLCCATPAAHPAPIVQHQHHGSQNSVGSHPSQIVAYDGHSTHTLSPMSPVSGVVSAPVSTVSLPQGAMISTCSSNYVEPITNSSSYSTPLSWVEQNGPPPAGGAGAECTICYENPIDAVLYMCGHMCMCYECALQQWRGEGGGHCPFCRAVIRDVIRTYK